MRGQMEIAPHCAVRRLAVWLWLNRNAYAMWAITSVSWFASGARLKALGKTDGEDSVRRSDGNGRTVRNDGAKPCIATDADHRRCRMRGRAAGVRTQRSHLGPSVRGITGAPFAVPELTRFRIDMAVRGRCSLQEQHKHVNQLGVELHAACTLSLQLGCEMSRCLQAVAASLKRQRLLDDLRANAFAMPQATVKLLMALPLLTVTVRGRHGSPSVALPCGRGQRMDACLGFACVCSGRLCRYAR